jgi:hypothetical protein
MNSDVALRLARRSFDIQCLVDKAPATVNVAEGQGVRREIFPATGALAHG